MNRITTRIEDQAGPYLERLAREFPREFSRGLKAAGRMLGRELRGSIRGGGPKGARWKPRAGATASRRLEKIKSGRFLARSNRWSRRREFKTGLGPGEMMEKGPAGRFFGRLGAAVRVKFDRGGMRATVGWIGRSAAGVPLSEKTRFLNQPERPLVKPVFEANQERIGRDIEKRVRELIRGSAKKARAAALRRTARAVLGSMG